MAAIRKSNLRGKKRWLGRDSARQANNFRSYRASGNTNLPPLTKPQRQVLSRQRHSHSTPTFWSKGGSNVASVATPSEKIKSQRFNSKNSRVRDDKAIPVMPDGSKIPVWLMRWNSLHRHSGAIAFLLVSATLVVYGWTVYSQHLWSRSYKELQDLQRNERQLTKHDATLKNRMSQDAEKPHSGFVSPTPANTIFLEGAAPSSSKKVERKNLKPQSRPSDVINY